MQQRCQDHTFNSNIHEYIVSITYLEVKRQICAAVNYDEGNIMLNVKKVAVRNSPFQGWGHRKC